MPYVKRKKYARKNKKRSYGRRKKNKSVFSIGRMPVPKSAMVKLKYLEDVSIGGATGVPTQHFFRCNSLYDPNFTGIGHQPLAYDQLSIFYTNYTVVSAKITATFSPVWGSGPRLQRVGIQTCSSNDTITNITQLLEQGDVSYRNLTNIKDSATISRTYSAKKFNGLAKGGLIGNLNHTALTDTNPIENTYFRLMNIPIDGAGTSSAVVVNVKIEYIAVLTEPRTLAQS